MPLQKVIGSSDITVSISPADRTAFERFLSKAEEGKTKERFLLPQEMKRLSQCSFPSILEIEGNLCPLHRGSGFDRTKAS